MGGRSIGLDIIHDPHLTFAQKQVRLSNEGMRVVYEFRGIGVPICTFISEQVSILHPELQAIQEAEDRVVSAWQKHADDAVQEYKALELRESELKRELRRWERQDNALEVARITRQIEQEQNPTRIHDLRERAEKIKELIKDIRRACKEVLGNVLDEFSPDIDAVFSSDPRCRNRSERDAKYIRQCIFDIIVHCAEKGIEF